MKRLFTILTVSALSILSVFAANQKYFFYRVDEEFTAVSTTVSKPSRVFKVDDWFMSPDIPKAPEPMSFTIDGVLYHVPFKFSPISAGEYYGMLNGEKILNDQDGFLAAFKKYPEAQQEYWDSLFEDDEDEPVAKKNSSKKKSSSGSGLRILYFILLLIPVLAPIVLLVVLIAKYEDRLNKNLGPSVVEPWMAIGLCIIETLILLLYGKLHVYTNPNVIPLSTFWMVVLAIILGYIVMKGMVAFNRTMLALYGVKITILNGLAIAGIITLVLSVVVIVFGMLEEKLPTSDTVQQTVLFVAIFIAVLLYLIKIIRKQNSDALVIVLPMVILSIFGAAWLLFLLAIGLVSAFFRGGGDQATCEDCRFCEDFSSTCRCTRHNVEVLPKDAACSEFQPAPKRKTKH